MPVSIPKVIAAFPETVSRASPPAIRAVPLCLH
jgi:hypothetical protein